MGAGDVKLALGLGALTGAFGADVWLLGAVGAPALTALFGLLARVRTLPHGPSMCVASLAAAALAVFRVPLRRHSARPSDRILALITVSTT